MQRDKKENSNEAVGFNEAKTLDMRLEADVRLARLSSTAALSEEQPEVKLFLS